MARRKKINRRSTRRKLTKKQRQVISMRNLKKANKRLRGMRRRARGRNLLWVARRIKTRHYNVGKGLTKTRAAVLVIRQERKHGPVDYRGFTYNPRTGRATIT
jgi:hypothetical protein